MKSEPAPQSQNGLRTRVLAFYRRHRSETMLGIIVIPTAIVLVAVLLPHVTLVGPSRNPASPIAKSQSVPARVDQVVADDDDVLTLPGLPSSMVPEPPPAPAPEKLEKSLEVVDMGAWQPKVIGITPEGWNVAPDPERELEYSGPGIKVRVPVYRIVPNAGSIYIIEPGRESGFDIPETLKTTADRMEKEAEIFQATASALAQLLPDDQEDSPPPKELTK